MEKAQASGNPKLYLIRSTISCMYVITNSKGDEISSYQRFNRDWEAIEWARAYCSSWLTVELVCFPEQLKSNV